MAGKGFTESRRFRNLTLDVTRVHPDAEVYVDGKSAVIQVPVSDAALVDVRFEPAAHAAIPPAMRDAIQEEAERMALTQVIAAAIQ